MLGEFLVKSLEHKKNLNFKTTFSFMCVLYDDKARQYTTVGNIRFLRQFNTNCQQIVKYNTPYIELVSVPNFSIYY